MDQIWLIVQREYITRVRKKSFIIMTFVGPLLMSALFVVPIFLMQMSSDEKKIVTVADAGGLFSGKLPQDEKSSIRYVHAPTDLEAAKAEFKKSKNSALLYVPPFDLANPTGIKLFGRENLSLTLQTSIQRTVNRQVEAARLQKSGIDQQVLDNLKADVDMDTVNLSDEGEKSSNSMVTSGVAYFMAFLIYLFIFLYGVQIMRGVIEEKTSRIVEVIMSSVKPFQLMMGKVIGIAAVGLTQLLLWVALSSIVITGVSAVAGIDTVAASRTQQLETVAQSAGATPKETEDKTAVMYKSAMEGFSNLNLPLIIGSFLFYFLGGYLLYGALFGAIGAAVDNETDTQQFMLPITMPLILTFIVAQSVMIRDPNGPIAYWMSMIPFTSPIAMVIRIPFGGVTAGQLLLSMALLVAGFVATIWIAARIYRVGILLYGKKVTYKELSRWMFYKG
ncbi:ABC transporter permease [Hymenobacter qilianensis]|uniref:ABC transporter permease n=2 Tax=Hymenobacter qilianensis TaxID=1385715 RepID=A0ACB5PT32_9BACT|nr:ABC transporter permease [Hymenobacter qilianensis]QNP52609.1 ABC transporter permease [Hymenobacter qilianensis]GGF69179.1 ABC transporter permease [Hymenobacter qilianensis]